MPARSTATRFMIAATGEHRFTLDSNILVYSVASAAGARHELAAQIALRAVRLDCWLTLQALGEFYSVVTRKSMMPRREAAAQVNDWLLSFPVTTASAGAVQAALLLAAEGRASYWDGLLVTTAKEAGCHLALSEDMADGSVLGGVQIHNPFARSGGLTERTRTLLGL
jgi:predicted nucleic acid-binding protein